MMENKISHTGLIYLCLNVLSVEHCLKACYSQSSGFGPLRERVFESKFELL